MSKRQAVGLFEALDDLGVVAEFLSSGDFDVTLDRLEEARVRIRRVATQLATQFAKSQRNRPTGP